MLVAPAPRLAVDELGRQLAVVGGHREQLDARDPLGRPALVDIDVGGGCRDHRAPAGEHRLQPHNVGTCAVEHRERLDALTEVTGEDLLQTRGVVVLAVGDLVPVVRGRDRGEHVGVDAGVVVGGEAAQGGVMERSHAFQPTAGTDRRRLMTGPAGQGFRMSGPLGILAK